MTVASPHDLATHLFPDLRVAGVHQVRLQRFLKPSSFRGEEVSPGAADITHRARELHLRQGFGFWQAVLKEAGSADRDTRRSLMERALRHATDQGTNELVSLEDLARRLNTGALDDLPPRTVVSIRSRVAVDGRRRHIPMLDLGLAARGANAVDVAVDALTRLAVPGVIFASGRSFHFYGTSLLDDRGMVAFLAGAQLLSPIVDERWVSHQLIDGECALRLGSDTQRSPEPIRFVAVVSVDRSSRRDLGPPIQAASVTTEKLGL
jgi:hypothetical protein